MGELKKKVIHLSATFKEPNLYNFTVLGPERHQCSKIHVLAALLGLQRVSTADTDLKKRSVCSFLRGI